jgi:hypothetical protein
LFYPGWRHGAQNEHWQWLFGIPCLEVRHVIAFFNAWRPLSKHQPQVLLLLASAFPDQEDQRRIIENNFREEAGMQAGHDPHHKLLDDLIRKLGGQPTVVHRSESIMSAFHNGLYQPTSPARSAGLLAGIENPALDISSFFREVVRRSGFEELLVTDLYLDIHTKVEPIHIVDTHEIAQDHMAQGTQQREEVITAFREVMTFWSEFWSAAFDDLKLLQAAA